MGTNFGSVSPFDVGNASIAAVQGASGVSRPFNPSAPVPAPSPTLAPDRRAQLDGIVHQMTLNKEKDPDIQFVVNDFKSKYAEAPGPTGPAPAPEKPGPFSGIGSGIWNDLVKPTLGIAKPLVQGVTSAVRSIQSTPDVFKALGGNQEAAQKAQETMAKPADLPVFGQTTPLQGLSPLQATGLAAEVGANLIGIKGGGTLESIAGGTTRQALKQGFKQGFVSGSGGYLENAQDPTVLGTLGSGLKGGATGALTAGTAAKIAPKLQEGIYNPKNIPKDVYNAGKSVFGKARETASSVSNAINPDVQSQIVRAVKPKNVQSFKSNLQTAHADIHAAIEKTKAPESIDDMAHTVGEAKKNVWKEYEALKGPHGKTTIDGNTVADAVESSIDKRFALHNPSQAGKIKEIAQTYRRQMSIDEAEQFLQSANADLHSYYAKNKVGQKVAEGDPTIAYTVKEANALRESLYAKLDELTGKDAGAIKKRYGALSQIQEDVARRQNVVARANPDTLAEQISYGRAIGKVFTGNPIAGIADLATTKMLKDRSNTNVQIKRAFGKKR